MVAATFLREVEVAMLPLVDEISGVELGPSRRDADAVPLRFGARVAEDEEGAAFMLCEALSDIRRCLPVGGVGMSLRRRSTSIGKCVATVGSAAFPLPFFGVGLDGGVRCEAGKIGCAAATGADDEDAGPAGATVVPFAFAITLLRGELLVGIAGSIALLFLGGDSWIDSSTSPLPPGHGRFVTTLTDVRRDDFTAYRDSAPSTDRSPPSSSSPKATELYPDACPLVARAVWRADPASAVFRAFRSAREICTPSSGVGVAPRASSRLRR